MQEHHRSTTTILRAPKLTMVVLFLTGGLVGVMAYQGTTGPLVWVLAVLLGIRFRNRFPRPDATWREPVTVFTLLVAGGVLGAIAYYGALQMAPAFAVVCVTALALAPTEWV